METIVVIMRLSLNDRDLRHSNARVARGFSRFGGGGCGVGCGRKDAEILFGRLDESCFNRVFWRMECVVVLDNCFRFATDFAGHRFWF